MSTTLRDVARLAQVSVKTVSNVVNGYPHVSDGMRRRVEAALAALDYHPNRAARTLRTGRTRVLALTVAEADGVGVLARAVVRAAARHGYRVVIDPVDPECQGVATPPLSVDGCLLLTDLPAEPPTGGPPVVRLGQATAGGSADRVGIDHARATRDAVDHLVATGRSRIAAIGVAPGQPSATIGRQGYAEVLRAAGRDPLPGHLQQVPADQRSDGYRAARALLSQRRRPDAVVCASDALAIGALCAAADAGVRVPQDLAVIGVGGSEEGRWTRPALSTVAADPAFLARQAVARIVARIARPDAAPVTVVTPHTLLARESTRTSTSG
ncbi:LacI family DNA-binding transcriptional regulator [Micromonospora sp. C28SCA-DRY-2]|uniref:LacI family DNA-binding transcriptional regulator n=1 Tax=Micromonospora sp. C28SCA-DRY-2 TaxID=3059522 RepID=UPI0026747B35|nr:LacI family DNA-binding transcriptional regulator [Micromonospora sp. C28SCA-DRY-2]MDO3701567.1 LacI family DNA-binding transcriptional regulator [Micromonospora sp. C28SCA-DRY-2]